MTGIIFTGGEGPEKRFIEKEISPGDFIIAADSGLDRALYCGYSPDLVVGDMDSVKNKTFLDDIPDDCVKIFPEDKDETDTEIALRILKEMKADRVILAGGGGGRMDHLLGIVSIFDRSFYPDVWYTAKERIVSISGRREFGGMLGDTVSLFPAGVEICRMKSTGLKWNLDKLQWEKGDAGISNIVVGDPFTITILSGRVLLISFLKEFGG